MAKLYRYEPVGFDLFTDFTVTVAPGTLVVKTQPAGCPRNGTMGHAYIARADTGEFIGLRLLNSLQPVKKASA